MFKPTFYNRLTLHLAFTTVISRSISGGYAVVGEDSDMPYCWVSEHVDITGTARRAYTHADVIDVPLSAVAGTGIRVGVY